VNGYGSRDSAEQKFKMKSVTTCIALAAAAIIVAASTIKLQSAPAATAEPTSQPKQSAIDSADRLFQAGKFAEAGKLYSQIVAQNPKDYSATLQLSRIALLSNRLDDAQKWLETAISLHPDDADAKVMVAEGLLSPRRFHKSSGCTERR
jgi:predicted Zn-dependent protease